MTEPTPRTDEFVDGLPGISLPPDNPALIHAVRELMVAWAEHSRKLERELLAQAREVGKLKEEVSRLKNGPLPTEVSIHGMYDCHLFHPVQGTTVDEVIASWLAHNAEPQPAIVGGDRVDDLGQSSLCPAIVLAGKKELRRVGRMVFAGRDIGRGPAKPEDVEAYRAALLADPDIPLLLAARALLQKDAHD